MSILRNLNGSLTYVKDGHTVTVGTMDPDFTRVDMICDAQGEAFQENKRKADTYRTAVQSYQNQIDGGRPITIPLPTAPLRVLVDDDGNETEVPFDPPLPGPVFPVITPAPVIVPSVGHAQDDMLAQIVANTAATLAYTKAIAKKLGV